MKTSLRIAFVVFVVALLTTAGNGLQMVWRSEPPTELSLRILGTSSIIMFAALFYFPVGEALNRVLSGRAQSPKER